MHADWYIRLFILIHKIMFILKLIFINIHINLIINKFRDPNSTLSDYWEATWMELSPKMEQSSFNLCCISGMPASCPSSLSFSSLRLSLVAVSSSSILQLPSPSNWSRWLWKRLQRPIQFRHLLNWYTQAQHLLTTNRCVGPPTALQKAFEPCTVHVYSTHITDTAICIHVYYIGIYLYTCIWIYILH